ncbi:uncharacterized protein LOC110710018 [Chenopodium quinoa]|uniref:uncharacterized protein LOC110710018 n=1 Tax=Chenopodium quinoa TaxID=63459 RepID=UPI000B78C174|nr:uncharacterized protein LOC110710018 [Chenopodium quinoa]
MIILSWNIRGLNDPCKVVSLKKLLAEQCVDVVGIMETKVKCDKSVKLQKKFGSSWSWFCNYSSSHRGRLWVGWFHDKVNLSVISSHEQFIHVQINSKDLHHQIFCTFVHGLHSIHDRLPLWDELMVMLSLDYEVNHFRSFVDNLDLGELKSKGSFYSWSNKGHGDTRIATRIDRGLVNQAWLSKFPHVESIYLPPLLSYHNPLLVEVSRFATTKGRPFRFLNCLADHADFCSIMEKSLHSVTGCSVMVTIWQNLKSVKKNLKDLNTKYFANVDEKVDVALAYLKAIQDQLAVDYSNSDLHVKEAEAVSMVKHWMNIQESIYKQKSRVDWIKLGDSSSHYFFSVMKHRQGRNRIDSIFTKDDVLLKDPILIENEIVGFYKGLLGSSDSSLPAVDLATIRRGSQLSSSSIDILTSMVTTSEIDSALAHIGDA